jgi:rhamnulokinase
MSHHYLACDLGAESGRLMLGSLQNGGRLVLEEIHRFANTPVASGDSLHWNISKLLEELKVGLRRAASRGVALESLSTDSWGVDYLFLDEHGEVLAPTFHYRDPRTAQGVKRVQTKVDWNTVFAETGIQFMPLNTLYQLAAETPARLGQAKRFLMIADAFNYFLSGVARIEESNASTTQFYNPRTRAWSAPLLSALGIPESLLPAIVPSGTRLGELRPLLAQELGLPPMEVIAGCSHDTGAAVAAVPAASAADGRDVASHGTPDWAYLSSGTWSLMGVELPAPLINERCRELNFTNEIGYGGSVRLLKNISGLWLVQECRRHWAQTDQELDYGRLTELAAEAPAFRSLVNPADPQFTAPGDMPGRIAAFCRATQQPAPENPGEFVRCCLESLALLYRVTLRQIQTLLGRRLERLHIVGGGSRNTLLNQFTANALQLPVLAGPVEATAAGNCLVQALALGHLSSLAEARQVVRQSFELTTVQPQPDAEWERQAARFERLLEKMPG